MAPKQGLAAAPFTIKPFGAQTLCPLNPLLWKPESVCLTEQLHWRFLRCCCALFK